MTNQEAFTKIVKHVLSQKEQCADEIGCLYAGPNGNACAIGCLFPRELASRLPSASILYLEDDEAKQVLSGLNLNMLWQCQRVHDTNDERDSDTVERMRSQFELIAKKFNLVMPT